MILILGAGISGLSLAWYLQYLGKPYRLLEASARPGGLIGSQWDQNVLWELGPNSLLAGTAAQSLIAELGLQSRSLTAQARSKNRYILRQGRYQALPSGPLSLLFGSFFSWETKKTLWRERSNPGRWQPGETLAQFFTRRFGQEVVDYALAPFVAGIYAGRPQDLLVELTFPQLIEWEKTYGSVLKGLIKNTGGQRKPSLNFDRGLATLTDTLASRLSHVDYGQPVTALHPLDRGWRVTLASGEVLESEQVVSTLPTYTLAPLVAAWDPAWAQALEAVVYPPMVGIHSLYRKADVLHPLEGFGGLHPAKERALASGVIWASSVFAGKCPPDQVLLTSFIGGVGQEDKTSLSDAELLAQLHQELVPLYGIKAPPLQTKLLRWKQAIPQYDAHLAPVWPLADAWKSRGLFVSANWYRGVSLNDCIEKGQKLAQAL